MFPQDKRPSNLMESHVHALTDQGLADLASRIGGLDAKVPPHEYADRTDYLIAIGADLAQNGNPDAGVPGCLSCHSAEAVEGLLIIPRLQGQRAPYIIHRLEAFSHPWRPNGIDTGSHSSMFEALEASEIEALAAYFAEQPPLTK